MRPLLFVCLFAAASNVRAQTAPLRLEPVVRIGCADCDGAALLTTVSDIAIAHDRIYIVDATAPHIRVFDNRGRALRAFGSRGEGPGEFSMPVHIGVRAAGELDVFDYAQGRFTRFDSLGGVLGTRRVAPGEFPVLHGRPGNPATYVVAGDFGDRAQRLMRIGEDESSPTTLPALNASFPVDVPHLPLVRPALAARPGGGVAVGDGRTQYRIRLFDEQGAAVAHIVRDIPRVRKTREELQRDRARYDAFRETVARRTGIARLPDYAAEEERRHFTSMEYDEQSRLWVRTHRGDPDSTVFDLFDASRRYLGEVKIPGHLELFAVGSGLLAARVRDADGVDYVSVWRVR